MITPPMTADEQAFYKQIRAVDADKALAAAKSAMSNASAQRFKAESAARIARISIVDPVHEAYRAAMNKDPNLAAVRAALQQARKRPAPPALVKPVERVAAKAPRLRLGSVHLVDTAPFQALTWQAVSVYSGPEENTVPQPNADGQTGDMSFSIIGSGWNAPNNSEVSCWCAIGQTYVVPPGTGKPETGGATLRFSASPSFNWSAAWGSDWWRNASGNIWIGQVVNRFDQNWAYVDTPVSYQQLLFSWNDYNFADNGEQAGVNSSYGLTTSLFVLPAFFYNCWVWVGASAYGDLVDSGLSFSYATMNANVDALILDSF